MQNKEISFIKLIGKEIDPYLMQIAELRIKIFRDWPYLYEGSFDYELKYLSRYTKVNQSFIILAYDQDQLIGASSCIWLPEETDLEIKKAFINQKYNLEDVVYFGESILLKQYRGIGIGSQFMKAREEFAIERCYAKHLAFCSVVRDELHSLKPKDYTSLEVFWSKKGFIKQEHMLCKMKWKDLDQSCETEKILQFWVKTLY